MALQMLASLLIRSWFGFSPSVFNTGLTSAPNWLFSKVLATRFRRFTKKFFPFARQFIFRFNYLYDEIYVGKDIS